jgi:hypothetical protein
LGLLLTSEGDIEGARAAYQLVIDSHGEDAARAAKGIKGLKRIEKVLNSRLFRSP